MGYIQTWDSTRILNELHRCSAEAASRYNDGYTAWNCKKTLLDIKFELDEMIKHLPSFSGEDEYYAEQDKKRVWRELNAVKKR